MKIPLDEKVPSFVAVPNKQLMQRLVMRATQKGALEELKQF